MKSNQSEWATFFNQHAPAYEDNCFTKNTLAEVDFIVEVLGLSSGMSVIDVGCGTGRHAIQLARRGLKVTGIDISHGMLEVARHHAEQAGVMVDWIEADARNFSLPKTFDAGICLCEGSLGLLGAADDPIEQPLAILRTIAESLKAGAPVLLTVLNGYRPDTTGLRERGFVPTELRLLFQTTGLVVEHIGGGTAGNWGKRLIDLDEIELMVMARKPNS